MVKGFFTLHYICQDSFPFAGKTRGEMWAVKKCRRN